MTPLSRRTTLKIGSLLAAGGLAAGNTTALVERGASSTGTSGSLAVEVEGPLQSVDAENETLSVMGITIDGSDAAYSSPTASLTIDDLEGEPFPGRETTPGFIGGTAIVTGTTADTGGPVVADDVFVEVAENVILGAVTENTIPVGGSIGDDGTVFDIQGVEIRPVGDPRIPFGITLEGLEVDDWTIPVGSPAVCEGHFGDDGVHYSHTVEATQGDAPGNQTSVNRAQCDEEGRLELRGASSTAPETVTVFDHGTGTQLGTADVEEDPQTGIGHYRFREDVEDLPSGSCPLTVRVENTNGSQAIADL